MLLCFENATEDVYYYTTLSYVLHSAGLLHFPFASIQILKNSWKKTIRYSDAVNRSEREYNDQNVREKKDKLWTVKHYTLKAKD